MSDDKRHSPVGQLEQLDQHVQQGFLLTHSQLSEQFANLYELSSTVFALADLFIEKGLLTRDEVEARAARVRERLARTPMARGLRLVLGSDESDKYQAPVVKVDCEARLPACRAACCALDVALTRQDIEEGIARFDLTRPYHLRRGPGAHCTHLAPRSGCSIYANRPGVCRAYSCSSDQRIWLDFAAGVPNTASIDGLLSRTGGPRLSGADRAAMVPSQATTLAAPADE